MRKTASAGQAVIVAGSRTPFGNYQGLLSSYSAVDLAVEAGKSLLKNNHISPKMVSQLILGNVYQAALGQNTARQTAIQIGLDFSSTAFTVNQACASGMKAVQLAAQMINSDPEQAILAGGTDSMTNASKIIGDKNLLFSDGLIDPFNGQSMGFETEILAEKFKIDRQQQDQWLISSQKKAAKALNEDFFKEEIVPLKTDRNTILDHDETIRRKLDLDKIKKLKAAFKDQGTITAATAANISDGACLLLITSKKFANQHNWPILAQIGQIEQAGVQPELFGYGPVTAARKILKSQNKTISQYDLFEINEAFAAQTIVDAKELSIPYDKINLNGGSLAFGHPLAASGARIIFTLAREIKKESLNSGIAMICVGGGMGMAMEIYSNEKNI